MRKIGFWLLLLTAVSAAAFVWQKRPQPSEPNRYRTEAITRGDIARVVTANGTLNPVVIVNVGTQISGTIAKLYVDFNQRVQAGQVLAELDPALLNAQLAQSTANLANAKANLKLAQTKENRTRSLVEKGFLARSELDIAVQTRESARAQIGAIEAQIERDRANLRYSVIRAPISGVVVARSVDLGQTVAASFQTPTLFQIAQDLTEMRIETSVAEADIGLLSEGQPVAFSVDAYPGSTFQGVIKQIRLNPTVQQNVVTYNAVVAAANPDGKLLPGMTAHVKVEAQRKPNVLRAPNAALRFKPSEADDTKPSGRPGSTLYVLRDGNLAPVSVKVGISDGTQSEILEGSLSAGDQVVTREAQGRGRDSANFRIRMF